jgi:UDP-N-acetylmuramoylalanine--D-glutamate ligase
VVKGVEYVNDSKGTNVDSTIVALKAFPRGIWLIAGGRGKGTPYEPMVKASEGRVKCVLTIGEDAPRVRAAYEGKVPVVDCRDLATAVRTAHERAAPGDVCCSRRPAPATTSSRTSRSAASERSRRWSRPCSRPPAGRA